MATVKTGWLKDNSGVKFAPKTLVSQVTTDDGINLESKLSTDYVALKEEVNSYTDNKTVDLVSNTEFETKMETEILKVKNDSELYTNTKIADLINGAPTTLDTLGEIATAMGENQDVVEALEGAVGKKANQSDLTAHTGNTTVHITADEREFWNDRIESLNGEYDLGNMSGKTVTDLKTALDTWLNTHSSLANASAYFNANSNWISLWNAGDTTSTMSAGGKWTVTIISTYSTKAYTQLRISSYYDKRVVFVHKNNSTWGNVYNVATKDDVDLKQDAITGGASTITSSNLTANRALISNSSGKVAVSAVTSTELGYLDGVTSSVQTQLDALESSIAEKQNKESTRFDLHPDGYVAVRTSGRTAGGYYEFYDGNAGWADILAGKITATGGTVNGNVTVNGEITTRSISSNYYNAGGIKSAGWYRIYSCASNSSGLGTCTFTIGRSYNSPMNEEYNFSVSVGYNGHISISQLSGTTSGHILSKIRVVWKNSAMFYIDFYNEENTHANTYYVYNCMGYGHFQDPTLVTSIPDGYAVYEFTTVDGAKSDNGYTGNLTGNADSATKVYATLTNPSSGATYNIPFSSGVGSTNISLLRNDGIGYWTQEGTTSSVGVGELKLGNNVASGTAGNKRGMIYMYGTSTGYTEIKPTNDTTSHIVVNLPSTGGTLALTSHTHNYAGSSSAGGSATSAVKLDSSAGSTTQPVYFSGGKPVATTYTLGKSVPSNAVFTDTKVTQGVSSTASYRPLLLGNNLLSSASETPTNVTDEIYGATGLSACPKTGTIRATQYNVGDGATISWDTTNKRIVFGFL